MLIFALSLETLSRKWNLLDNIHFCRYLKCVGLCWALLMVKITFLIFCYLVLIVSNWELFHWSSPDNFEAFRQLCFKLLLSMSLGEYNCICISVYDWCIVRHQKQVKKVSCRDNFLVILRIPHGFLKIKRLYT